MKVLLKILFISSIILSISYSNQYVEFQAEKFTKAVAKEISKSLPQRLNYMTMLTSVKGEANNLFFKGSLSEIEFERNNPEQKSLKNYTLEEKELFKKELITQMQEEQLNELCSNMTTRTVLESGVNFKYTYYFKSDQSLIGETNISSKDCNLIN